MQHVDVEAELAAGRVNDIEASISGQSQLDIEVDIRAGEGPRGTGRVLRSAASFRASTRPLWSTVPRPLGHVIDTRSLAFLSSWGLRFRKTHEPPFWRPFRAEEQLKSASRGGKGCTQPAPLGDVREQQWRTLSVHPSPPGCPNIGL